MNELYSIRDVATIFGVPESRLRYWIQTGFVAASAKKGGRLFYRFGDLVSVKAALDLLDAGLTMQHVRKNLDALRKALGKELADNRDAITKLRICSDGDTVVALDKSVAFEPSSGQVVMDFAVHSLHARIANVLELPIPDSVEAAPSPVEDAPTEAHGPPSAYGFFLDGIENEERGDEKAAEHCYRRALELEESLAAAHTNLGNILFRRSDTDGARIAFETALEYEPHQPEARYNLGNLLDQSGETEHAIAELRRVCRTHPEFADAHYNLGLILARVGGVAQARTHLEHYLSIDTQSDWADRGRSFLAAL